MPNGENITFASSLRSNPPRFEVEEKVMVRYDPEAPENATVVGLFEEWMFVIITGGLGVFFLFFSAIFYFVRR